MPNPITIPDIRAGQPMRAADMQPLIQAARRQSLLPGQFQSGSLSVQRPIGRVTAGGGDPIVYGQLIKTVPANGTLADAIWLENYSGWFGFVLDGGDKVTAHAGNPSLYSAYRGSEGDPVRVWGVMRTAQVVVSEETVDAPCFIIHGEFKDQLAAASGFVTSPDNDKG